MVRVARGVNIVKHTELYTSKWFKWFIFCYVYFIRKKIGTFLWAFWGRTGGRVEDRQARACARRSGMVGPGVELCPGVVQQFLNVLFLETSHPLKKFEDPEELWFVWIIFIDNSALETIF